MSIATCAQRSPHPCAILTLIAANLSRAIFRMNQSLKGVEAWSCAFCFEKITRGISMKILLL